MKRITTYCLGLLAAALLAAPMVAQTPDEQEKKLYNWVQGEVDRYETTLDLEYWQVFYVDSILTHNYGELNRELTQLSRAKVSNSDIFIQTQDKWEECTYEAFHKVLNDEQWEKYLKTGAARDKKARDKRAAKK